MCWAPFGGPHDLLHDLVHDFLWDERMKFGLFLFDTKQAFLSLFSGGK